MKAIINTKQAFRSFGYNTDDKSRYWILDHASKVNYPPEFVSPKDGEWVSLTRILK